METEVEVGQIIAGKYRVEEELGRGGMGVVMAALHTQLNQRVALKFLTEGGYQQPEAVARFLREARSAVQIQSEHVARVMDVGTLDSGAPYMVMEYLRGRDLKAVSVRRGALPITEAVDYVLQACDAVAEAHSLGIIHRDLKPSNLFLTERADGSPMVKVLDFGISKALHGADASQMQMTASAAIMGSPQYMSPEQIRSSKNVDARADVWALGVILHELLTGAPAYQADTVPGLLAMIVADAPPPLSNQRPDAPRDLESCVLRCLEKDRNLRFSSVAQLARALEPYASPYAQLLVRRIARILGDDAPPATVLTPEAHPLEATVSGPTGQTNGSWTRTGSGTGSGSAGNLLPLYRRPNVQLGAGLGAATLLILGAVLFVRPTTPENDSVLGEESQAAAITPSGQPTPQTAAPATSAAVPMRAPSVGVVRSAPGVTSPAGEHSGAARGNDTGNDTGNDDESATDAEEREQSREAEDDAKPERTGHSEQATRTRSVSKKRARAPRARAATTPKANTASRSTAAAVTPRADAAGSASTGAAPAKPGSSAQKSDTLDLFNDTK